MPARLLVVASWLLLVLFIPGAAGLLNATQDDVQLIIQNDRLIAAVLKASGVIYALSLDGQNLLGEAGFVQPTPGGSTDNGDIGIGPYLDCVCVLEGSGSYTPGSIDPTYQLITGVDSTNTSYGGIVMSEIYPPSGQLLEQYWFLRDGETGLHTFSRLAYHNSSTQFLRNLQEFRTLFRPNTTLWTDLLTNEIQFAPLPSQDAIDKQVVVQDATWSFNATPDDPYVIQESTYFTKYMFADTWRDHNVHGMYSDGTTSVGNFTFGSWLVQNTKDTYFGGPLHSDLVVDGIVYNYIGKYELFLVLCSF
jgi:rhamnogalacturonan endolyase